MKYLLVLSLLMIGCSGPQGNNGKNAKHCTVATSGEGDTVINCQDGSFVVIDYDHLVQELEINITCRK